MDVYVVPVGPGHYELYCEEADEAADAAGEPSSGFIADLARRFRVVLAYLEHERHRQGAAAGVSHRPWTRRAKDRVLRWIAEKIAEQRLLWHLRRQREACAIFPDDLSDSQAMTAIRRVLQRDADRHRLWLVVHAIALALSGLLAMFPGPNVIAYYFAFRVVGHYLSMRGARHGLNRVKWRHRPSAPLAELRHAIALAAPEREQRVSDIASRLRLPHLAGFFKRVTIPSA